MTPPCLRFSRKQRQDRGLHLVAFISAAAVCAIGTTIVLRVQNKGSSETMLTKRSFLDNNITIFQLEDTNPESRCLILRD